MAHVEENYPLYYDAINEKGLGIAGLNFVGNAKYNKSKNGKTNIAQYEFIPWILSQSATVEEAKKKNITVMRVPGYSPEAVSEHAMALAFSLAEFNAGSSIPARIAMIAITMRSSIRVKIRIFTL